MASSKSVYWRRAASFPVAHICDVDVVPESGWGAAPLDDDESHDMGWHRIYYDAEDDELACCDISEALGLCGDLTNILLIAEGVVIYSAIVATLGLKPPLPTDMVYDCPWNPEELDDDGSSFSSLQCACSYVYEEMRAALHDRHGIEIMPLEGFDVDPLVTNRRLRDERT